MDNFSFLNESFDNHQMADAFDIENMQGILEMPSFSAIEDPSDEPNLHLSNPPVVFTASNIVENPNNMQEEHTVASCSDFGQPKNMCLLTGIIGEGIMVYDGKKCVRGKETPKFLRHLHSIERSSSQIQNAIDNDSNTMRSLDTSPSILPMRNSMFQPLDEYNIHLSTRKMDDSAISDESVDVDQMVKGFDIENLLKVLGISSFLEISGSERVENASDKHISRISSRTAVFTGVNGEEHLIDMEEHVAVIGSNFSQTTDVGLTTDTIEKTPEFFGNSNLHSVESSSQKFNHRKNKSADIHVNTDVDKSNEDNGEHLMEESDCYGISNSVYVQNSSKNDQPDMFGLNINERQIHNAINDDSNRMQSSDTLVLHEPLQNSTLQQLDENNIDLAARKTNNSVTVDESMDFEQMVAYFDTENLLKVLEISSFSTILCSKRVENESEEPSLQHSKLPAIFTGFIVEDNLVDMEEHAAVIDSDFDQPTDTRLKTETIAQTQDYFGNSNSIENSADEFDHQYIEPAEFNHIRAVQNGERSFQCEICEKQFTQSSNLKRHIKTVHDGEKPFPCKICEKLFARSSHLKRHIDSIHNGETPFQCEICEKRFTEKGSLKTHIRAVHNGEKPFPCKFCEKQFATSSHLKRHISAVHNGEKPFHCEICEKHFARSSHLKKHFSEVHSGGTPFRCAICEKQFTEKAGLKKHIGGVHNGETPFQCEICEKQFTQGSNLKLHIRAIHNSETPFQCESCEKQFSQSAHLKRHISVVHNGEKPFQCKICEKRFTESGHLKTHIRAVHNGEKPFKCKICEKQLSRSSHLKRHIGAVHNDETPFQCAICEKQFTEKSKLKNHIRAVHNGEILFQCEICEKQFTEKSKLKRHIRVVHNGEKPFQCKICEEQFAQSYGLKKHIGAVHDAEKKDRKRK